MIYSLQLKQLLVKTKKDLSDAKKLESEQRAAEAVMQGQLEMLNQQVRQGMERDGRGKGAMSSESLCKGSWRC